MTYEQWLQSRLTAHGFACGAIDGVIGSATIAALKAFQKSRGLPETGRADTATVDRLRMTSGSSASSPSSRLQTSVTAAAATGRNTWPKQDDCMSFYGAVGSRQTTIDLPYSMVLAWDRAIRVRKMTLHEVVAASAMRVLHQVAEIYTERERADLGLDVFGGSLNVRRMRGGSAYSMHSWGIAIDFDPERNGLQVKAPAARLSHPDAVPFWEAWEAEGWISLGRARDFDWMHVQAARL
ncbi:peptidoglycan-binding protein [Rhizobium sp. CSW-27]|uniref:peptidoglycan-binding protein n=1 Tax=Rhizobium sp. CSW-27 TaxID=2839985 RepID=UPI001C02EDA9|nr:peptidoglycan-binding protein [Rhizobium sp. CSW-27]MBT9370261.1 peptidoglycan-binding protein [Rhizobium sp. CSW-27]